MKDKKRSTGAVHTIVFGSDQGLVGQFNESLAEFVIASLSSTNFSARENVLWAIGERVEARLRDFGLNPRATFPVPNSVSAITHLVGQVLATCEVPRTTDGDYPVYLFHNRPESGALYVPNCSRILPLDRTWLNAISEIRWPTHSLPEVLNEGDATLHALIREYLFVSMFKACAESLAAENANRLSAMQRAKKNIDDLLGGLEQAYHHQRQSSIDEELFDLVSGFEALKAKNPQ